MRTNDMGQCIQKKVQNVQTTGSRVLELYAI